MKKLLCASVITVLVVGNINTNVSYGNSLDKPTQSHLVSELTKANKQATELQKVLDYIDNIIAKCKPMTSSELEQLLK